MKIPKFKEMYLLKSLLGVLGVYLVSGLILYYVLRAAIAPGVEISAVVAAVSAVGFIFFVFMWPCAYILLKQEGKQKAYVASIPAITSVPLTHSKFLLMFIRGNFLTTTEAWNKNFLQEASTFIHLTRIKLPRPISILANKVEDGYNYYLIFDKLLNPQEIEAWGMFKAGYLTGSRTR